jgi:iron complex transport system permease protein
MAAWLVWLQLGLALALFVLCRWLMILVQQVRAGARRDDSEDEEVTMAVSAAPSTIDTLQRSAWRATLLCLGILVVLSLLSLMLGTVALGPQRVLVALVAPGADPPATGIVRNLRLPRMLLAWLAGACGGVTALLLGHIVNREVCDPGWGGVLPLGALAAILLLLNLPTSPWWALVLAVLLGCGVAVAVLTLIQRRWSKRPGLLISCSGALALLAPLLTFVLLLGELRIATWVRWSIGSLEQRDWSSWQSVWHIALVTLVLLCTYRAWPRQRALLWASVVLAATTATLAAGAIGLLGFVAGTWAARASRHSDMQLVLASLVGATLLLGLDLAARGCTAVLPSLGLLGELPVGALVVLVSPFVLLTSLICTEKG